MKKWVILITLGLFSFILSACSQETEVTKVIVPSGAPAFSQVAMEHKMSESDDPEFDIEVVFGTDMLAAAFNTESHEIIYAPTNLGARLIQSADAPYQYFATISKGNLYLATKQESLDAQTLAGAEIIAFGVNATPGIILETILDKLDLSEAPEITYVDDVATAAGYLTTQDDVIVLLAEPLLSVQNMQLDNLQIMDLQAKWSDLVDESSYPQAGVFVHNDLDEATLERFEALLKESVNLTEADPALVADYAGALGYEFPKPVLIDAMPRSNLSFVKSDDAKTAIEVYFNIIMDFNPELIGGRLPDDSFYRHLNP